MSGITFLTDLLSATFAVILTSVACAGWGYVSARLCKLEVNFPNIEQLWLGFAALLAVIGLLNFFFPVNWIVSVGLLITGALFLAVQLSPYMNQRPTGLIKGRSLSFLLLVSVCMLFVLWAIKAMESPGNYDSGLYHFNSIRWINEHPLIAGLGNLHDRLAFNQNWFGFAAFLNLAPIFNKGYAIAGLFILSLSVAHLFIGTRKNTIPVIVVPIFLYSLLLNLSQISSPSPDIPVNILQVVITVLILQLFLTDNSTSAFKKLQLTTIAALCVSLVTIKLSGAAFAATALIVTLIVFRSSISVNRFVIIGALSAALYLPHLFRGYLLSGAPLFPSTFGAYDVFNWSMSFDAIRNIANWIYCWARSPGPECMKALGSWGWLGEWWQRFPNRFLLLLMLSSAMFVTPFIFKRFFVPNRNTLTLFLLSTPALGSFIFWFFTIPDPRFLGSIVYVLFGIAILFCLTASNAYRSLKKPSPHLTLTLILFLALIISFQTLSLDSSKLIWANGFQSIKSVQLLERKTASGLSVYIPAKGDQCFDSPLPCTPYFDPNLRFETNRSDYPKSYFTKRGQ